MLVEHGDSHLCFERAERWIGPPERRVVRDVGERHRAARVRGPGRPDRARAPVGERMRLLVTRRAGKRAVARETRVVEETTAEADLGHRHRVVRRNFRSGKTGRQLPCKRGHRRGRFGRIRHPRTSGRGKRHHGQHDRGYHRPGHGQRDRGYHRPSHGQHGKHGPQPSTIGLQRARPPTIREIRRPVKSDPRDPRPVEKRSARSASR